MMIKVYIDRNPESVSLEFPSIGRYYNCKYPGEVFDAIRDFIGNQPYELIEGVSDPSEWVEPSEPDDDPY